MKCRTLTLALLPVALFACNPKPPQGGTAAEAPASETRTVEPSAAEPSSPGGTGAEPSNGESSDGESPNGEPGSGGGSIAHSPSAPAPGSPLPRCGQNFTAFDADLDQRVSLQEFMARPHAAADAESIFRARDRDADGSLSADEFCSGWRPGARAGGRGPGMGRGRGPGMGMGPGGGRGPGAGPRCEVHFERFDTNGDGNLSEGEFTSFPHPHADPHAVFVARDQNGDGSLSKAEFCSRWGAPPRP